MFPFWSNLTKNGVLSINKRNGCYVLPYNERRYFPLVDDKLKTKELARNAGLGVPELYGSAEIPAHIPRLLEVCNARQSFVIKPANGSGGNGILVIREKVKNRFRTAHGPLLTEDAITHHLQNVLSGIYSLSGQADTAMVEERIEPDPIFENVTYRGVPDIRIIVFLGVPVMAMLRLPTSLSEGKANLHQGAIGVGVSISEGVTATAVCGTEITTEHPDTAESIIGIQLPQWDRLLSIAARCYELTKLGYQGVDIVLDKNKGPIILELNARPGLNIQLANRAGLIPRLQAAESFCSVPRSAEERVQFAKETF